MAGEQKQIIDSLHVHGLETHELTDPMTLAESLGVRINGSTGQVGAIAVRDWHLDRALEGLASCKPSISGRELDIVVGHMTVRALLHRDPMSVLRHAYVCIHSYYNQTYKLWASVALEMRIFRDIITLGTTNLFTL